MHPLRTSLLLGTCLATSAFAAPPTGPLGNIDPPKDEKAFLERVHHTNQMEIELGQLAQQNASSQEVKDYGAKLVTEHQEADAQLMSYARQNKLNLSEPKASSDVERKLMESHKADAAALKSLQGKPFDTMFMANMVAGHDMAISKIQAGISQFSKTSSLLQPVLPKLMMHREMAYKILGTLKPESAGVGGSGHSMDSQQPQQTPKNPH